MSEMPLTLPSRPAPSRRLVLRGLALSVLPASLSRAAPPAAPAPLPHAAPAAASAPLSHPAPVHILYDVFENPPLIEGNGTAIDPARPGLMIELLHMAAKQADTPITLSRTPWQRGLYLIQAGEADAIFLSSYTKARLSYGVYPMKDGQPDTSRKMCVQSYRLYVRAGSNVHWDGRTLTNVHAPVGATPGYAVIPVLRAMGVEVEPEPSHIANLRKLAAGRLDAYAELDNHIRPLLRADRAAFGSIIELSPPVLSTPYYLMFSKVFYNKTPRIAEHLWDAIAVVNDSAAYQALLHSSRYAD